MRTIIQSLSVLGLLMAMTSASLASGATLMPALAVVTQAPHYPAQARALGLEGLVLLELQIDASGEPSAIAVRNEDVHPMLQDAALRSVRQWSFAPAKKGGKPVASTLSIPIRFELLAGAAGLRSPLGPASLKARW